MQADHLVAASPPHPPRVAVDGVTASGKTTFADELATNPFVRAKDVDELAARRTAKDMFR